MQHKQQVVVIHGGTTFPSYEEYIEHLTTKTLDIERLRSRSDWKGTLQESLGEEYDVLAPRMPNGTNAQYNEWSLWFERVLPLLTDNVVLVGHSLGGVFLAKYLSLHTIPKTIRGLFLVSAPFDDDASEESLASFTITAPLAGVMEQIKTIHLYHSEDDPVVPFAQVQKYMQELPDAVLHTFSNRGHFLQETFPELVEDIAYLN